MKTALLKPVIIIALLLMNYASFSQRWEATLGVPTHNEYSTGLAECYDKVIYIVGGIDGEAHSLITVAMILLSEFTLTSSTRSVVEKLTDVTRSLIGTLCTSVRPKLKQKRTEIEVLNV